MKEVYLVYNRYTQTYHYYEGKNRHNLEYINSIEEVYSVLKRKVKNKSNVILNLEDLEEKILEESIKKIQNILPKINIYY
ncbi:MAG: hypothetical protein WC260_02305 [Candidatus Pacearchaeota archaeon]